MDSESNHHTTRQIAKGKLTGEAMAVRLRELVGQGMSLADIRAALGIDVSRQALHKRISDLGLVLKRESFAAAKPEPALGRRVPAAVMAKYARPKRARDKPWLDSFSQELDELLAAGVMTYAEIWDELLRRHPFVPQLAAQATAREKSLRISVWVSRQRGKY
ncbi:hypothetical protein [Roseateles sp. MS654]|uniref:hypothetical protein n=1 Tax=Roseateles sp. MS654 TaxID=3412685 RepID=UPI003C2E3DB8